MESVNVVINEEQSTEDHSEVFQGTQSCHTNSEDTLPKEYVSMPDDQELQILNDAVSNLQHLFEKGYKNKVRELLLGRLEHQHPW